MMLTRWMSGILPGAAAMLLIGTLASAAEDPATVLEIKDDPAGGKRATATLRIAAHPEAVRAILNDFMRWPELFAGRFQLVKLDRQEGRVVTHLRIKRSIKTVGVGVETAEQFEFVKEAGCDEVQGFLVGEPLPAERFRELLSSV